MLRPACLWSLAAMVLLAPAVPAAAQRHDSEALPAVTVRDLPYGDALFYDFQGKDFEAATRLLAYRQWHAMPHHQAQARLLLGGLYLSLGMYTQADALLQRLLTSAVPTGVRNRAWLFLGQTLYLRARYAEAERDLLRIRGRMSPQWESQKELLLANVWMHEGRFDRAVQLLSRWHGTQPAATAYARLNLGIALIRQGRLGEAAPVLAAVGGMDAITPEMLALKDRANLTLGVAYLKARQASFASAPLDRVRLHGPFSGQALLAAGWAQAAQGNFRAALTPWLALHGRSLLDPAVVEAYLTVPYALVEMKLPRQAVDDYRAALHAYDGQVAEVDGAIARVRGGSLMTELLAHEAHSAASGSLGNDPLDDDALPDRRGYGRFWHLAGVPDDPESRYLYATIAEPGFQAGLRNYRDLKLMQGMLAQWSTSMAAFREMIAARHRAFAQRLPAVATLLSSGRLARIEQRRAALAQRLVQVQHSQNGIALATAEERGDWGRILKVQAVLARDPDTPVYAQLRERLRRVKGVLLYRMHQAFPARLWQEQKRLRSLDLQIRKAHERWMQLAAGVQALPIETGHFTGRVAALQRRIDSLQARLEAAQKAQSRALAVLAVRELEGRKRELQGDRAQAQFALATIYDQASHPGEPGSIKAPPRGLIPEVPQS